LVSGWDFNINGNDMKKYQIIYADPPWPIKIISRQVRPNQKDMPYKTMSYKEICDLPVKKICDEDEAHLFLWTTQKWLPKAFKVMDDWGFQYNCTITWDKTYGFTPFSFMWSTEFLLYGQLKNKWKRPIGVGKYKTCFTYKPLGHSVKPDNFREMIVDFCGDKPRIELFARERVNLFGSNLEGWDVWGNEVESDIEL
jgi:N6-adenosine-specific RNA methylase IME4